MIDKNKLEQILNNFAKSNKIFTNESQFQFELSRAIDNEIIKYKKDNNIPADSIYPCVKLEVLSMSKLDLKKKTDKLYTDIVVCLGENESGQKECIAIELKYKMINKNLKYVIDGNNVLTFSQGAYDEGSIQFLKDVERLEKLTLDPVRINLNFDDKNIVKESFAIIMSNDKSYWENKDQKSIYNEFYLDEKNIKTGDLKLNIYIDKNGRRIEKITKQIKANNSPVRLKTLDDYEKYGVNIKRSAFVTLKGKYLCQWQNYDVPFTSCKVLDKNFEETNKEYDATFKYLIFDIKNQPRSL